MPGCRQALRAAIAKLFGTGRWSEEQPASRRRAGAQRGAHGTPEPPADEEVHTVPGYYIALAAQPAPVRVAAPMRSGRRWLALHTVDRRSPDRS